MKKINTSTYYLFNISILLEQYLHIQKQVSEHLLELNELSLYNKNHITNNIQQLHDSEFTDFLDKCNNNINNLFSSKNEKIPEIIQDISNYLKKYCNHEWVNDDIDLHLDKTVHIYYCNYCGITKNH